LKAVAVRAEDPKVLESVIGLIAVDVIELQRNASVWRLYGPTANLALSFLQARREESILKTVARCPTSSNKDLFKWKCRSRNEVLTLVPSHPCEVSCVES
jgi:hypothetical protein